MEFLVKVPRKHLMGNMKNNTNFRDTWALGKCWHVASHHAQSQALFFPGCVHLPVDRYPLNLPLHDDETFEKNQLVLQGKGAANIKGVQNVMLSILLKLPKKEF